jgi:ABC-type glycerol-3-phosphate transport system permease component
MAVRDTVSSLGKFGTFRSREKTVRRSLRVALLLFAGASATVFMLPFFWTVSSSLKDVSEIYVYPPRWLPATPRWYNYVEVFTIAPFGRWLWNSGVVTSLTILGVVLSGSVVAYSFARFRYPGRDIIFLLTLGTMMLPVEVTIIPQYLLFHRIGWLDTFKPLIVPHWCGGGAFSIFLLRQFFMTIPRELDEAALMDGASSFRILWNIIVPLSKPALATLAVITFISSWNSFMPPLIFLNSPEKYVVAVGLKFFQADPEGLGIPTEHLLMAGNVLMTLPSVVLFFAAQRFFVRGVVLSGIKG